MNNNDIFIERHLTSTTVLFRMVENSTTVLSGILKSFDGRTEAIAQPRIEPESSLEKSLESKETLKKRKDGNTECKIDITSSPARNVSV